MKLVKTIVLNYYRLKIKLLELVSPATAAKTAFELFCTPYTRRRTLEAPEVFEKAKKLHFYFRQHHIHGFTWMPERANGKKVLICHGFDSYSYKFDRYIEPLTSEGYQVYAFDAPAHGNSSGKTITALLYRDMITYIFKTYGAMDVVIAHSFGCIAASLAVEKSDRLFQRLILIAPATETTRSIQDFANYLKLSKGLVAEFEKIIMQMGDQPSSWYSVARVVKNLPVPTLWLHDKYDPITPYEDIEHLVETNPAHVEFYITENLGHSIYRNEEVAEKIIRFIKQ